MQQLDKCGVKKEICSHKLKYGVIIEHISYIFNFMQSCLRNSNHCKKKLTSFVYNIKYQEILYLN